MGCDGGTIPRRDELVKTKKKSEEKDKDAAIAGKWHYCALSCTKLRPPIVSCELGQLYNKDSVIEFLLNKDTFSADVAGHIRNLKDIVELKLTEKNGYEDKLGNGGEYVDSQNSRYICPVVGLEMNGKYKFYYSRKCGCVVSERALKEVKSETCHKCGVDIDSSDLIVLNGSDDEVSELKTKMTERRAKSKSDKKGKKRKTDVTNVTESKVEVTLEKQAGTSKQAHFESKPGSISAGPSRSSKTTKVSTDALLTDKAKSGYSIANDANATETYKSLFTTHKTAQNRKKAHWVTYNPLYF